MNHCWSLIVDCSMSIILIPQQSTIIVGKIHFTISKRVDWSSNLDMQNASVRVKSFQSICWIQEYCGWFKIIHWTREDNDNKMSNKSGTTLSNQELRFLIVCWTIDKSGECLCTHFIFGTMMKRMHTACQKWPTCPQPYYWKYIGQFTN